MYQKVLSLYETVISICMYPKVLSPYETMISICMTKTARYNDPNGIYVIDPNMASISVNCMVQQLYPYSIPLQGSKKTIHVYFMFSTYRIFLNNYCHPVIICDINNHLFVSLHFSYLIICMNKYGYHVCL